jgi:hypothetical protein
MTTITVIKSHSNDQRLTRNNLKPRSSLLKDTKKNMETAKLRPKDILVDLIFGGQATVSIFELETMIMSLLTDPTLMHPKNIAPGYNIFTGKSVGCQDGRYGKIHREDAWEPAHKRVCGDNNPMNMRIALVIFGEKSHFGLHGSLLTLPIIFTLTCFYQESRNKEDFWRPLAFLPNLSYGALSTKNSKKPFNQSYQDQHDCLRVAFSSLQEIHKKGGMALTVIGKRIVGKVWIHFCVGDSQGNNQWLGHYNGSGNLNRPYQDCHCSFMDMDKPNPRCV